MNPRAPSHGLFGVRHLPRDPTEQLLVGAFQTSERINDHRGEATGPVSHAEIVRLVEPDAASHAAVYQNLQSLVAAGVARRVNFGDRTYRFELVSSKTVQLPRAVLRFVCTKCGQSAPLRPVEYELSIAAPVPQSLASGDFAFELCGLCDECR